MKRKERFYKRLQVSEDVINAVEYVSELYDKQFRKMSEEDKIDLAKILSNAEKEAEKKGRCI